MEYEFNDEEQLEFLKIIYTSKLSDWREKEIFPVGANKRVPGYELIFKNNNDYLDPPKFIDDYDHLG